MYSDSVLYTIGTALNRAHDNGVAVQILVEGQWLSGRVAAVDGHGVVLHSDDAEHSVIRMGSVSAVRMFAAAPMRTPLNGVTQMPMPMPSGYENAS
jgi:sRNA-binding regulator protein Hfq